MYCKREKRKTLQTKKNTCNSIFLKDWSNARIHYILMNLGKMKINTWYMRCMLHVCRTCSSAFSGKHCTVWIIDSNILIIIVIITGLTITLQLKTFLPLPLNVPLIFTVMANTIIITLYIWALIRKILINHFSRKKKQVHF